MVLIKKWLLIFLGSLTWSLTMVKSGILYPFGLGFWGANGHDGIWHIALAESLVKGTLKNPVFSGFDIQNYHIGFDIFLALIHKITSIPVINLYFQIFPPIIAFLIGVGTYNLVRTITKSDNASLWSTFFVYFGGSFGYLINKGESAFWSQQSISTLVNPPFSVSLIMVIFGILMLIKYEKNKNIKNYLLTIVLFGLLAAVKIYASLLVLVGLFVVSVYKLITEKNNNFIYVFIGTLTLSLIVYLPLNKSSQNIVVWQPFWFLETMMATGDRVGWDKFYSAMSTYKSGHFYLKGSLAYSLAFLIFIIGNMGTRVISFYMYIKTALNCRKAMWIDIFFISIFVVGTLFPMFVLQKGTPWNTIQFLYYSLFVSSITSGIFVSKFIAKFNNKLVKNALMFVMVVATIPTTYQSLTKVYIPSRPPAILPNDEVVALKFLSTQSKGTVLTYPFDEKAANQAIENPPRPLYLYVSTSYVSAFSKQSVFIEDEVNLDITGYDWKKRKQNVLSWYKENNQSEAVRFLKENNIVYIYWLKGQRAVLGEGQLGLKNIFENSSVTIYKVD